MNEDVNSWARECIACQKCKVNSRVRKEVDVFPRSTQRFHTIHLDISTMEEEFMVSPAETVYGEKLSVDPVLNIRAGLGDSGMLRLLKEGVSKL